MELNRMPDCSNLHGTINSSWKKMDLANVFADAGWKTRRCTWVDYEVECDWADLVIDGDSPVLIHGQVKNVESRMDDVAQILQTAGLKFELEAFRDDGDAIGSVRSVGEA